MLEFEKKLMLTVPEYRSLMKLRDDDAEIICQTNYYYDSDWADMNALGITCRIREKNGRFEASLKAHQGQGCSVEKTVSAAGRDDCTLFRGMNISLQGSLKTVRTVLLRDDGVEVTADRNTYLGHVDYELEIEFDPSKEKRAEFILKLIGKYLCRGKNEAEKAEFFRRQTVCRSKSERFFEIKKQEQLKKRCS